MAGSRPVDGTRDHGERDDGASGGPEPGPDPDAEVVVVTPAAGRAAAWTLLGAAAIAASGWALGRGAGGPVGAVAAVVLMALVPVTGLFALQVFAPGAWTLRIGGGVLRGFAMGRPVDVELTDVRRLRLARVLGDRALVVETERERRRLWLPVGADVRGVRRLLARLDTGVDPEARPPPHDPSGAT